MDDWMDLYYEVDAQQWAIFVSFSFNIQKCFLAFRYGSVNRDVLPSDFEGVNRLHPEEVEIFKSFDFERQDAYLRYLVDPDLGLEDHVQPSGFTDRIASDYYA